MYGSGLPGGGCHFQVSRWSASSTWPGAFAEPLRDLIQGHRAIPQRIDQVGDFAGHAVPSSVSLRPRAPGRRRVVVACPAIESVLDASKVFLFRLPHSGSACARITSSGRNRPPQPLPCGSRPGLRGAWRRPGSRAVSTGMSTKMPSTVRSRPHAVRRSAVRSTPEIDMVMSQMMFLPSAWARRANCLAM